MAPLIFAFLAGIVLGTVYFGGLWITVQKTLAAPTPAPWLVGSFIVRAGIVLGGLYLVGAGSWQCLLLSLLGFLVARTVIMRRSKKWDTTRFYPETKHS